MDAAVLFPYQTNHQGRRLSLFMFYFVCIYFVYIIFFVRRYFPWTLSWFPIRLIMRGGDYLCLCYILYVYISYILYFLCDDIFRGRCPGSLSD